MGFETVGQRIKSCRLIAEQTQEKFSAACGVSQSFLSEIENDISAPSFSFLVGLSKALPTVDIDFIVTGCVERRWHANPLLVDHRVRALKNRSMTKVRQRMISILEESLMQAIDGSLHRVAIIRNMEDSYGVVSDVVGTATRMEAIGMIEVAKLSCFSEMEAARK